MSDSIKIVACYGQDNADRWGMYKTTQQAAYYEENQDDCDDIFESLDGLED